MKTNNEITSRVVLLIDEDGKRQGQMTIAAALFQANQLGLDLVEVSPNAEPPVCKILDYGKMLYEQKKNTKKVVKVVTKEIRLRPNISDHDLDIKRKRAKTFLDAGNNVLIKVLMRGRENIHPDLGFNLIEKLCKDFEVTTKSESKREGRTITRLICQ